MKMRGGLLEADLMQALPNRRLLDVVEGLHHAAPSLSTSAFWYEPQLVSFGHWEARS